MKQTMLVMLFAGLLALQGCVPEQAGAPALQSSNTNLASPGSADTNRTTPTTPTPTPQVVARIDGKPITMDQLMGPLVEGYGLNVLLNMVQLDYTRQQAQKAGVAVSTSEIEQERDATLVKMFQDAPKADYSRLLAQLLEQQHISRVEFELVMENNAYLRKIAEPYVQSLLTEDKLQEGFRQLYGETVRVRHIELRNMTEVLEAQRRLAAGDDFAKVSREISLNSATAPLGGELPPFSRSSISIPQVLRDASFALKEGQVSDPLLIEGSYHLVKLEQRIAPRAIKYEDVKQSVKDNLRDRAVQARMQQLRTELARSAIQLLQIEQPVLKAQYEARLNQRTEEATTRDQTQERIEQLRQKLSGAATSPAEDPTTQPATGPAPEVARPPATQP